MTLKLFSMLTGKRSIVPIVLPPAIVVPSKPKGPIVYERYSIEEDSRPWIKATQDGHYLDSGPVPGSMYPDSELELMLTDGVAEIAPGRWLPCGGGDYKEVYRPEDGKADYVVKHFKPPHTTQKAANEYMQILKIAYGIIEKHIGEHVLKVRDVKVAPMQHNDNTWWYVYKLQEWGELGSTWLIEDPSTRDQAQAKAKVARQAIENAISPIETELLSKGIIFPYKPSFDTSWDHNSRRLVIYDIIDCVKKIR